MQRLRRLPSRPHPFPQRLRRPDNPVGREQDEGNEHDPEEHHPVLRVGAQRVASEDEKHGADDRAEEAAHSPDQRHGNDLAGEGHVQRLRVDEIHQKGVQRPSQPRKPARDREGNHLVSLRVVADAVSAPLVLPGGQEHPAERRAHQSPDQDDGHGNDHRHQIVIRQRPCQVETGQGRALDPADAVFTARDRRGAVHDIEEHLREGEREQREVDTALPHQKEADDRPHQHRGRRAHQDGDRHALGQMRVRQGGPISPDPEEGPMTEGEQAAVP